MIQHFLITGAIKYAISSLVAYILVETTGNAMKEEMPEMVTYYKYVNKIEDKYKYTKKKQVLIILKNQLLVYILCCVPYVGSFITVLISAISVACSILITINPKRTKEYLKKIFRSEVKNELDNLERGLKFGETAHREITDALRIDGLSETEIIEEFEKIEESTKNYYLREDNSNAIKEVERIRQNLELLKEVREYLRKPQDAYRFTLDKSIEYADVNYDDNTLTIEASKPNGKILKRKFEMKH